MQRERDRARLALLAAQTAALNLIRLIELFSHLGTAANSGADSPEILRDQLREMRIEFLYACLHLVDPEPAIGFISESIPQRQPDGSFYGGDEGSRLFIFGPVAGWRNAHGHCFCAGERVRHAVEMLLDRCPLEKLPETVPKSAHPFRTIHGCSLRARILTEHRYAIRTVGEERHQEWMPKTGR